MDQAREVVSTVLAMRKAAGLRVRQPLPAVIVALHGPLDALAPHVELIADEVNVKSVELTTRVEDHATFDLQVVPARLGPRLGADTQRVIKAVKAGDWSARDDGTVVAGGTTLQDGEFERRLVPRSALPCAALPANAGVVVLDTTLTPELQREGLARDVVRIVQQARRDAGLAVSDRIELVVHADATWLAALDAHRDFVANETLAVSVETEEVPGAEPAVTLRVAAER
jgi:isoleucyl-tRNA synthetase